VARALWLTLYGKRGGGSQHCHICFVPAPITGDTGRVPTSPPRCLLCFLLFLISTDTDSWLLSSQTDSFLNLWTASDHIKKTGHNAATGARWHSRASGSPPGLQVPLELNPGCGVCQYKMWMPGLLSVTKQSHTAVPYRNQLTLHTL
jgi:hypothetical protein